MYPTKMIDIFEQLRMGHLNQEAEMPHNLSSTFSQFGEAA